MKLPNDTVEKLIANRFLRKSEYHPVILPNFDRRHYENKDIGLIMSILVEYTRKYSKVPSDTLAKLMLRKSAEPEDDERKPKHDARKLELEFDAIAALDLKADEEYVKENVVAFVKAKSFYFAIMDNLEVIEKDREVSKCQKEFEKISAIDFDQRLGMNYFADMEAHWESVVNPEARISTGFDQLDRVMNGGIYKNGKCLMCFMAQAGLGKSLMLSNLAVNFLKQNLSVVIISLEMCEDVYAQRVDAHISACDINQLRFNREESTGKIESFKKLYPKSNLFIKEYPPESINTNTIKSYLEKVKAAGYQIDVIIVDYINLMMPNSKLSKDANSYERVGNVSRELRGISYEFNAPVISVTQCNRAGYDTSEISMVNTSESAGINHVVDFLGALWQQEGDREANKLSMTVLKNRFGGMIGQTKEFFINYSTLRISDMEREVKDGTKGEIDDILGDIGEV